MVVTINMSIPESCAECPLSVRHFGKLYCPPLDGRVGNEGKDSRCPLVDTEGGGDLISRQALLRQIDIDADGESGYYGDTWKFIDTIKNLPSAQPETNCSEFPNNSDTISRQAAIEDIRTMIPKDAQLDIKWIEMWLMQLPSAQPETNCSEFPNNSDTISRQAAIDAFWKLEVELRPSAIDAVLNMLKNLPSAQPETAKRIVGKSRDGMTLWYQCDMCNEPVDVQDIFCRGCGRRLTDE